ncbi:hypothetical protein P3T23_007130 [Paraburkholderia sp. GAS448]|uniref:DUF1488 family protein n=1 Tax=Paraburkholderia sp. GAS448 TaxID=3035136 RepID=UPI003D24944A
MHIAFPDDQPVFDGANLIVRFTASVDGEPVECTIAAEALEDQDSIGILTRHLTK